MLASACRRKREHSIGVSVSETTTDTTIAAVTVRANSRNRRPMMPPISSSGMNTATSEMLIDSTVKPISRAPLSADAHRRRAVLDMAIDVLHHHDGVVDHEADRDASSAISDRLSRLKPSRYITAVAPSSDSGTVTARNERGPDVAQEQQDHQHHQARW